MDAETIRKIGTILTGDEQRDAIHVAIMPVIAETLLYPGEPVNVKDGRAFASTDGIGVIDPFLSRRVHPNERVWLFLKPGTITSLRHEWTHPAIEAPLAVAQIKGGSKSASEMWLREFAGRAYLDYETVLSAARVYVETGEHYVQRDSESARNAFYEIDQDTFWEHYQTVTGTTVNAGDRGSVFCCSC